MNISIKVEIQKLILTFSSFKHHHNNPPPFKCWNAVRSKENMHTSKGFNILPVFLNLWSIKITIH